MLFTNIIAIAIFILVLYSTTAIMTTCATEVRTGLLLNDARRRENIRLLNTFKCLHLVTPQDDFSKGKWYQLDSCLSDYAQNWAESMANSGFFRHSTTGTQQSCGELKQSTESIGGGFNTASAYNNYVYWSELVNYDFNRFQAKTDSTGALPVGNFTRLIWGDSSLYGLGYAYNEASSPYNHWWVAEISSFDGIPANSIGYTRLKISRPSTTVNYTHCEALVHNYYNADPRLYWESNETRGIDNYLTIYNIQSNLKEGTKVMGIEDNIILTWRTAGIIHGSSNSTSPIQPTFTIRFCDLGAETLSSLATRANVFYTSPPQCTNLLTNITTKIADITIPTNAQKTEWASLCIISGDEKQCLTGITIGDKGSTQYNPTPPMEEEDPEEPTETDGGGDDDDDGGGGDDDGGDDGGVIEEEEEKNCWMNGNVWFHQWSPTDDEDDDIILPRCLTCDDVEEILATERDEIEHNITTPCTTVADCTILSEISTTLLPSCPIFGHTSATDEISYWYNEKYSRGSINYLNYEKNCGQRQLLACPNVKPYLNNNNNNNNIVIEDLVQCVLGTCSLIPNIPLDVYEDPFSTTTDLRPNIHNITNNTIIKDQDDCWSNGNIWFYQWNTTLSPPIPRCLTCNDVENILHNEIDIIHENDGHCNTDTDCSINLIDLSTTLYSVCRFVLNQEYLNDNDNDDEYINRGLFYKQYYPRESDVYSKFEQSCSKRQLPACPDLKQFTTITNRIQCRSNRCQFMDGLPQTPYFDMYSLPNDILPVIDNNNNTNTTNNTKPIPPTPTDSDGGDDNGDHDSGSNNQDPQDEGDSTSSGHRQQQIYVYILIAIVILMMALF